jgi:hypothetical protein
MDFITMVEIPSVAQDLLNRCHQSKAVFLVIVVDGAGKHRAKQPVEMRELEKWAEGKERGPDPIALPWYRKWFI